MNGINHFSPVLVGCSRHVSQFGPGLIMGSMRTVRWYELELITQADQGGVMVDGRFEEARPGRLYIRKPGMEVVGVHAFSSMSIVFDTIYDPSLQSSYDQHHYAHTTPQELAYLQNRSMHFSFLETLPSYMDLANPALLVHLFQQCLDWQIRRNGYAFFHQRSLLYRVIAAIVEEADNATAFDDSPTGLAVASVRDWMDEHYAQPITLEMLSQRAGLSREYLCRLFRRRYGLPPVAYLISVRLLNARRLLADTDDAVESIAAQCGLENLGHFYTCFKKHEGVTPARYRSQSRYPHSLQNS